MLEYFRHSTIKNVIAGVGTLFNDLHVARFDSTGTEVSRFKVPLSYGPKQKFIVRQEQDTDPDLVRSMEMSLPRLAFELKNISYDANRKLNTIQKTVTANTATSTLSTRYEKVSYDLGFQLHIITKNTEDGLQIIEQILPYFGPDFCITYRSFPVDLKINVPIQIEDASFNEEYEGDFSERKAFTSTITFKAKINLYGPTLDSNVILSSSVNFIDFDSIFASGTTTTPLGLIADVYGITGATFANVTVSVANGITSGSIGNTGSTNTVITEY